MFFDFTSATGMACARAEAAGLEMSLSAGRGGRGRGRSGAGRGGGPSRAALGRGRRRPAGRPVLDGGQGGSAGCAQDIAPVTSGEAASCIGAHSMCNFPGTLKLKSAWVGGPVIARCI